MNHILSKVALLALGLSIAGSANAIVINEYFIDDGAAAEFSVFNDSEQDIYMFAVASNDATYAEYSPDFGDVNLGWNGVVLSAEDWDSGYGIYLGRDIYFTTGMGGGGLLVGDGESGSFAALFSGYESAILFFVNVDPEENSPIVAGSTASDFVFYAGELSSPFVTYDGFGNVIETGETVHGAAVVPVPTAAWLFGSGLLGLAGVVRRKQS